MPKNRIVIKANDDIVSHCACSGQIATQGQADCPWCGCGWLFTCSLCRKAFTFGKVVETEMSALDIGRKLVSNSYSANEEVALQAHEWLQFELEVLEIGAKVVFLDGAILDVGPPVAFNGWFARHEFDRLPHKEAKNKADIDSVFGDSDYWFKRQLAREDRV